MKCVFEYQVNLANRVGCNNAEVAPIGIVPCDFCQICPWKIEEATGDFFSQTTALLVKKFRTGELKAKPKPCIGCNETKHRIPDGPVTQFVWPYWDGGANGDELRWSIRSVETFFQGRAKITLIGDKPDWYHGDCIRKKRVPASMPNRAFRDMLSKVWFIASHAEIDEQCVWMMDDIYFLKPFTLSDIETPRAEPWRKSSANSWQRRKTNTMEHLATLGATQHDYATHLPHTVEKQKLRAMFDEHDLHHNTMLWEVLYGNLYRGQPIRTRPFFVRLKNQSTPDEYKHVTRNAIVLNHTESAWCEGMREFLSELLPNPCTAEGVNAVAKPQFKIRKKVNRVVKRRPLETHRVYREAMESASQVSSIDLPHIMLIQSAYDDGELSASRLEIARQTSIPALEYQSRKPVVHITVNPSDPHLLERLKAFESTGCQIVPLLRDSWKLYKENWELPAGRKIVSRMDDDDVIARDYCKEIKAAAPESGEWNLIFPRGYVWWRSTAYLLEHPGIQFVTLVTDEQTDPHQDGHWKYHKTWQTKIVSSAPSWIWVRHGAASTSTLKRYRRNKLKGIDAARIPINLRAIDRAINPTGKASGNYVEHKNQDLLRSVLTESHVAVGAKLPIWMK